MFALLFRNNRCFQRNANTGNMSNCSEPSNNWNQFSVLAFTLNKHYYLPTWKGTDIEPQSRFYLANILPASDFRLIDKPLGSLRISTKRTELCWSFLKSWLDTLDFLTEIISVIVIKKLTLVINNQHNIATNCYYKAQNVNVQESNFKTIVVMSIIYSMFILMGNFTSFRSKTISLMVQRWTHL